MTKELLSVKEAAEILGFKPTQVYTLCYEGYIESFILDGTRTRRIKREALDEYIRRSEGGRNETVDES